jgi:hypothetical protein
VWPNQDGHFGRVDAVSHVDYESMPEPLVCAERVRQYLIYTTHPGADPVWDLPEEL